MRRRRSAYENSLRNIVASPGYRWGLKNRAAERLKREFGYTDEMLWDLRVVAYLKIVSAEVLRTIERMRINVQERQDRLLDMVEDFFFEMIREAESFGRKKQ